MKKNPALQIEITGKTILFTIGVLVFLAFIKNLTDVFINLFIAFILMSSLKPSVDWLETKRVPRSVASVLVILLSMSLIFVGFYFALPPLVVQSVDFVVYLSRQLFMALQQLDQQLTLRDVLTVPNLTQQIPNITNILTRAFVSVFGNILNLLSLFFFTLYFLLDIKQLETIVRRFLATRQANFVLETISSVEKQLGLWMRAELLLMLIIGLLSYLGLTLLKVNYALPLAVIAGMLEVFPIVGPVVSAIPAFIVGATSSWLLGVAVIALYIIIQQLENNLIVPIVMKKAIGIPPLAVLISVLIGQKLAGVVGIVLAVPFVATLTIIFKEIFKYKEESTPGVAQSDTKI